MRSSLKLVLFAVSCACVSAFNWPTIRYSPANTCGRNQTYNQNLFNCLHCGKTAKPKSNVYGCECLPDHLVLEDTGSYDQQSDFNGLKCKRCDRAQGLRPNRERDVCIKCPSSGTYCRCADNEIEVERHSNGSALDRVLCVSCSSGLRPSPDRSSCLPCRESPILATSDSGTTTSCNCSISVGVCLPAHLKVPPNTYSPSSRDETVKFAKLDIEIRSAFFQEHVKVAAYMCNRFNNWTACQLQANLCTLSLHNTDHPTCKYFSSYKAPGSDPHPNGLPHLYFGKDGRNLIGRDEEITNVYKTAAGSPSNRLNFTVAKYSLRGKLLGLDTDASGALFQMCPGSFSELDAAFNFGTRYTRSCKIPVHRLFARGEPVFYDLYVPYMSKNAKETHLFAVPMLMRNLIESNKYDDSDEWELTSRFFLVDRVSGIPTSQDASTLDSLPKAVRYLSKMELRIEMLDTRENPDKAGRIYPPVAVIEYGEVSLDDLDKGKEVEFVFSVSYKMEMREAQKDIGIAVGVLSAFAAVWSCVETWSWHRRSGKVGLDPVLILKLLAIAAGNLANVFFCVIFFTCFYWFVFFKHQNFLHVMLPNEDQERIIKDYVISIFALKVIDIGHLLVSQMSMDIFLLDWERPKPATAPPRPEGAVASVNKNANTETTVSVWRTYLVANEWNEIQVRRKTALAIQIFVVVFILKLCGVENLASADASSITGSDNGTYLSEPSYVCRFALIVCIYAGVAIIQAIFWCGIYAWFVEDSLQQFIDVCSIANISVFVMANNNFGYYIHGKSAHGVADTDMATLIEQLQREADDFCGHRGLQAGSDDQTFTMALPGKLRSSYDRIVLPASRLASGGRGPRLQQLPANAMKDIAEAYSNMNRFLTRFLEHALRDLDYDVRDKLFLEKVLDCEFYDTSQTDKAVFYSDGGHSFDAVLLYGHEFALTMFDMMVFLFVDLFAQDVLLAGTITFFVGEAIKVIRFYGGKSNLARKTLVDKRFLI